MMNTDVGKNLNPVLTIIIATYNAATYIKDCLDSIIKNVPQPYELIIVDGESQDNTLEKINEFKNIQPVIICGKDRGIYDAMNKGTALATGKWVIFLGADDRILPSFGKIIPQLTNSRSIYYGNCINGESHFGGEFSAYKLAKMNLCHQAILYPIAVFRKFQFNLNYPVFADYLLNMQCWGDRSFKKCHLNIDLAYYNLEGYSSIAKDQCFKRDKPHLVKRYLGLLIYLRYLFRRFKESRKSESEFF